ncbi:methionyl-tRNA formyltransferase [Buchnera aphidicola (Aphis craccivora)]|uniref:Methionyl-tRNA formyltransferase n=1 Tax=Buchnera aphidicola (Aphis craccivora) TaxID=466616 RepID=A0A4D6XP39_9GAMM|nr:methionyl-tRNA formyltransferase [Buchnera aphidicola]QCI16718.1 methionyl-tRNA formyltransferase [Buchnera aphidicola (Aphis craccivora)]QLL40851.1 methionyl-tRNA formyltransferase [Buchnera aphidicola (Aphis craccivore)]WAI17693.1 MAG: methionyl-tRNA formyltransferase [Buchnera aphidicola (Aphis craccivora)]
MKKLKIIFAGTSYFSEKHLSALIKYKYNIKAVITQPDRPSGRGQKIIFSPVKKTAIKENIPILQPLKLDDEKFQKIILNFSAEIMIVVSYGQIIPEKMLSMFPKGCINVHASLLPRWRGASPIQSSILFGDKKTGISIIRMNNKIDAGNIIMLKECKISSQETSATLSLKLIKIGIETLLKSLYQINNNIWIETKQDEKHATFSKKILKSDALLNWNKDADFLERLIRAFNPWPICYFIMDQLPIKVWKARVIENTIYNHITGKIISIDKSGIQITTKNKILNVEKIQMPGKNISNIQEIILSKKHNFKLGKILS